MGLYTVHMRSQPINFRTTWCSKATMFNLLILAVTVITPLIVIYRSQGLWLRETQWREQADITFKHQVLFVADTAHGPLIWATNPSFNNVVKDYVRVPIIKSHEPDINHDGMKDGLHFSLELPLKSKDLVYSISLFLIFDYRLHHMCEVVLEGLGLVQHSNGVPMSGLSVHGDLSLHQRRPLPHASSFILYDDPILPHGAWSPKDWKLDSILSNYWQRNITTRLENTYTIIMPGESDTFMLHLYIHYPEQQVVGLPGFWLNIKWAWVQYLSVLVVVAYVTMWVKDWVFCNQLVPTWIDIPYRDR